MQFLYSLFALLLTFRCIHASLHVDADIPEVIYNGEPTPIILSVAGGVLGSGQISGVRTVLYVPAKRGPKFAGNITHKSYEVDGSAVFVTPVYGLATKPYQLGYSVEVTYDNGDKEWIDSGLKDVTVRDQGVNVVVVAAAAAVFALSLLGLAFLVTRLSVPGYWEGILPKSLHWLLPEKPKRN